MVAPRLACRVALDTTLPLSLQLLPALGGMPPHCW
eukprot:COSAG01_NODE_48272_length_382_cov_6.339223_1_plen_34_part_01